MMELVFEKLRVTEITEWGGSWKVLPGGISTLGRGGACAEQSWLPGLSLLCTGRILMALLVVPNPPELPVLLSTVFSELRGIAAFSRQTHSFHPRTVPFWDHGKKWGYFTGGETSQCAQTCFQNQRKEQGKWGWRSVCMMVLSGPEWGAPDILQTVESIPWGGKPGKEWGEKVKNGLRNVSGKWWWCKGTFCLFKMVIRFKIVLW